MLIMELTLKHLHFKITQNWQKSFLFLYLLKWENFKTSGNKKKVLYALWHHLSTLLMIKFEEKLNYILYKVEFYKSLWPHNNEHHSNMSLLLIIIKFEFIILIVCYYAFVFNLSMLLAYNIKYNYREAVGRKKIMTIPTGIWTEISILLKRQRDNTEDGKHKKYTSTSKFFQLLLLSFGAYQIMLPLCLSLFGLL